ncbi:PBSX family phage terminase large subunit [Sphingomonas sp. TX0522]|uniref:PBSX family phage terminase large subunit n=1 Tax=Sphingomonas sp. TX0522 TaxID=2479205 RepID=UPI0018DFE5A6|nr:PBSX family phage terminase large subunit [Sphingomonas sp. TX0522]MBI0533853.1 PBSX family phage terminase large subunit [Sphingomonas sp. TX0522]
MSEVIDIFPAYRDYLQPARFKVAYGGRGSAKTRTFATLLVTNVLYFGWRVVCFREIMESIQDSVYQEIVAEIDRRGLTDRFDILKTEINCPVSGGCFRFSGIRANASRLNTQKLKGFANFDAAWLEEANPVSAESWNALIPTMRKDGSEIWVSFNPENPLEDTYQRFVADPKYPAEKDGRAYAVIRKINFTDNPRFPKELRDDADLMRQSDPELYRYVYLGEPVADNALSIIKPAWIEAAKDAHLHIANFPTGGGRIGGMDVSGGVEGDVAAPKSNDPNALAWRYGSILSGLEEWQDENPNAAAAHAYAVASREKLDSIQIDDIGVGASVPGELRRLQAEAKACGMTFEGWTASETPDQPKREYQPGKTHGDMFANRKAQGWGMLADRFRNTWQARNGLPFDAEKLISIPAGLPLRDKLQAELSQPRRESVNGRMKVESKASLKKRGIPSHNLADAVVMAFAPGTQPARFDMRKML